MIIAEAFNLSVVVRLIGRRSKVPLFLVWVRRLAFLSKVPKFRLAAKPFLRLWSPMLSAIRELKETNILVLWLNRPRVPLSDTGVTRHGPELVVRVVATVVRARSVLSKSRCIAWVSGARWAEGTDDDFEKRELRRSLPLAMLDSKNGLCALKKPHRSVFAGRGPEPPRCGSSLLFNIGRSALSLLVSRPLVTVELVCRYLVDRLWKLIGW